MSLLIFSIAVLIATGLAAVVASSRPGRAGAIGSIGAIAGAALGLAGAGRALLAGPSAAAELRLAWAVPGGSLSLGLDPLAAFFLATTFLVTLVCALYGHEYVLRGRDAAAAGRAWLFFNLLAASIAVVIMARHALLFLMAWEAMAVASFFLVTLDDDSPQARRAGWIYLVAGHLGTACLIAFFSLLGRGAPSLEFAAFEAGAAARTGGGALFLLALVGFGVKAGIAPLHVWLPEAHPAAPSHVSALMSAVMIKTGVYGLLRALTFAGPPGAWWGPALIAVGALSGIGAIVLALAQRDLKRLLAYSSIENAGVIMMGIGTGLIGVTTGSPFIVALGFGGTLLHVFGHALAKALLFLAAGKVAARVGTRDIERLGGAWRLEPVAGAAFLLGAISICGLPPAAGFFGEFLILAAALIGVVSLPAHDVTALVVVTAALALIAGLACACFAKAFGVVFLGASRTPLSGDAPGARRRARTMDMALVALTACGAAAALAAPWLAGVVSPAVGVVARGWGGSTDVALTGAGDWMRAILACSLGIAALAAAAALWRRRLLARREVRSAPTWDCGYGAPTPRMQYTGSSFVQPLTALFAPLLRARPAAGPPPGTFPAAATFATATGDAANEVLFAPAVARARRLAAGLHGLQHGRLQLYILYIAATLVALLVWEFAWRR